jgi:hypothetical protein
MNLRVQVAPATSAASSAETGTCCTLAASIKTAKGSNRARYAIRIIPWLE